MVECANCVLVAVLVVVDFIVVGPLMQLTMASLQLLRSVSKRGVRAAVFDGIAAHMTYNPDEFERVSTSATKDR
jgi:hypothetical protein